MSEGKKADRPAEERIQYVHDMLHALTGCTGPMCIHDFPHADAVGLLMVQDALCWVLGHPTGERFTRMMDALEKDMLRNGMKMTRCDADHPDSVGEPSGKHKEEGGQPPGPPPEVLDMLARILGGAVAVMGVPGGARPGGGGAAPPGQPFGPKRRDIQ